MVRELSTLSIKDVKHLCLLLRVERRQLDYICDNIEKFYRRDTKITKNGKVRKTATPVKDLRRISDQLEKLLQRLSLPKSLHGGIKKRSCITNALVHIGQPRLTKFDIKDFFPSIPHKRVYRMFVERLGCSPGVARYLTRLTTLDGVVPQGSPTSTTIANLVSVNLANRLNSLSKKNGANHSQFVDDISISGPNYIGRLTSTVVKIIKQEGFHDHPGKRESIGIDAEQVVTGVKVNNGKDAQSKYIKEVRFQVESLGTQKALNQEIQSKTINSIKGKIHYIGRLNKGAAKSLRKRLVKNLA